MERFRLTWCVLVLLIGSIFSQNETPPVQSLLWNPLGTSSFFSSDNYIFSSDSQLIKSMQFQQQRGFLETTDAYGVFSYLQAGDVVQGDLNNDGLADVLFVQYNSLATSSSHYQPVVWIQNPDGSFSDMTNQILPEINTPSLDAELCDYDGDGDLDIFIGGFTNNNLTIKGIALQNEGNGRFSDKSDLIFSQLPKGYILRYLEFGNFTASSKPDLAGILVRTSESYHAVPVLMQNSGNGGFAEPDTLAFQTSVQYGWFEMTAGDLNEDGRDDLVFANMRQSVQTGSETSERSGRTAAFINVGEGRFLDITGTLPEADGGLTRMVTIGDINNDSRPDIIETGFIIMPGTHQIRAFIQQSDGSFVFDPDIFPETAYGWVNDVLLEDFNRDGQTDCFLATVGWNMNNVKDNTGRDILLLGNSAGQFEDVSSNLPDIPDHSVAAALIDANRDGKPDVVLANSGNEGSNERCLIYENHFQVLGINQPENLPETFEISNYPNPFNPSTHIYFELQKAAVLEFRIYNTLGQVIRVWDKKMYVAGSNRFLWDGRDKSGQVVPTGLYILNIISDGMSVSHKMILAK